MFTPFARRPREMRRAISRLARLEADARAARALSSSAASASTSGRDRVGTSRAAAVITDLRARRETSWWDRNAARNERREKERLERRDRALAAGDLAAIVDPPRRVALGREKNVLLNRELLNARGAEEILALCVDRRDDFGTFYTLVPIRPRWRGERRSLRTLPGVSLRPPHAFNPRPRRLSTPTDAFQLHPDNALDFVAVATAIVELATRQRALPCGDDNGHVHVMRTKTKTHPTKPSRSGYAAWEYSPATRALVSDPRYKALLELARSNLHEFRARELANVLRALSSLHVPAEDAEDERERSPPVRGREKARERWEGEANYAPEREIVADFARAAEDLLRRVLRLHWSPYDRVRVVNFIP